MRAVRCSSCGKLFSVYKSRNNAKFCSTLCAGNYSLPVGSYRRSVKHRQYKEIKTNEGWKQEHRWVMENYLGRKLQKFEEVHHINGDKHDNRIENLWMLDKKNHSREHFELFKKVQKLEWENKWLIEQINNLKSESQWRPSR